MPERASDQHIKKMLEGAQSLEEFNAALDQLNQLADVKLPPLSSALNFDHKFEPLHVPRPRNFYAKSKYTCVSIKEAPAHSCFDLSWDGRIIIGNKIDAHPNPTDISAVVALDDGRIITGDKSGVVYLWHSDQQGKLNPEQLGQIRGDLLHIQVFTKNALLIVTKDGAFTMIERFANGEWRSYDYFKHTASIHVATGKGRDLAFIDDHGAVYAFQDKSPEYLGRAFPVSPMHTALLDMPSSDIVIWVHDSNKNIYCADKRKAGWFTKLISIPAKEPISALYDIGGHIIWGENNQICYMTDGFFGSKLKKLTGHNSEITSIKTFTSGNIASSSLDGTIRIWSPE